MFDKELRSKSIVTEVTAESSIESLHIDNLNLDPSRVTQIFINLLTNAIKFMKPDGEKKLSIQYGATLTPPRTREDSKLFSREVHWAPKGSKASDNVNNEEWGNGEVVYLTFSLSDSGIGMSPDELDNIFERFQQANVATHVTYGGSGLGLFISKELTERMAGEIGVSSRPNEGSTFFFYIKTRRATEESTPKRLPLRKLPSDPIPMLAAPRLQVLLVEDNLINQRVLQKHLSRCSCDVEVANHGVEALDVLCKPGARFDVICMDVQMPIMDGLTCTREVRRLEEVGELKGRIPVIAVTANVRQEQIEDAIAAGADRVMQKPFKAKDLVDMMRELAAGEM
jgi:CheY-like chemotaxis protein